MKNKIKIILIIVLVVNIAISTFYLLKNQQEDKEQDKIFSEIQEIVKEDTEEKQEDIINIDKLYEINNDIVAWVKIEGTNINYPVMQTKDRPDYYLYKNFYKLHLLIHNSNNCPHRIFQNLKIKYL